MKKFEDVEKGLYYILIGYLLIVFVPILVDYISSIYTGKEPSLLIRTEMTSIISAVSTIILVIITVGYAKSTKELLDEQVRLRKLNYSKDILENVYSPLNNALNKFRWNAESLPKDRIPQNYNREFDALYDDILKINNKYNHLINQKIKNRFQDVWNYWRQYLHDPTEPNYNILNDFINLFNAEITVHYNMEKNLFNNLQQLGENMDFDEKLIESREIIKIFLKALKEKDKSFLDKFKDKKNLIFIQKLAELEISKIYSDFGIQYTIIGLGLTMFLVGSGNLANSPNYVLPVWYLAGIIIIIFGFFWNSLKGWKTGGRIDFLNDIILQVERKLP